MNQRKGTRPPSQIPCKGVTAQMKDIFCSMIMFWDHVLCQRVATKPLCCHCSTLVAQCLVRHCKLSLRYPHAQFKGFAREGILHFSGESWGYHATNGVAWDCVCGPLGVRNDRGKALQNVWHWWCAMDHMGMDCTEKRVTPNHIKQLIQQLLISWRCISLACQNPTDPSHPIHCMQRQGPKYCWSWQSLMRCLCVSPASNAPLPVELAPCLAWSIMFPVICPPNQLPNPKDLGWGEPPKLGASLEKYNFGLIDCKQCPRLPATGNAPKDCHRSNPRFSWASDDDRPSGSHDYNNKSQGVTWSRAHWVLDSHCLAQAHSCFWLLRAFRLTRSCVSPRMGALCSQHRCPFSVGGGDLLIKEHEHTNWT